MKGCDCRACQDRDARRFERIIGRSFTPDERVRLSNARMPVAPTWTGPAPTAAPVPVRGDTPAD